jgi:hypothetical protein
VLYLSKQLKKRIHELCGLDNLERDAKLVRASEILNSVEIKQYICNTILGVSYKDVEKAMLSIMQERQLTDIEEEKLGIGLDKAPLDPKIDFLVSKKVAAMNLCKFSVRYGEFTEE